MSIVATAGQRITSATPPDIQRAASAQQFRLADGGQIDRKDRRSFSFDGDRKSTRLNSSHG